MSIKNFVSVKKHHRGYLVRYPAGEADCWDYRTYRERYFESVIGGPRAYDEARRFATEIKGRLGDEV
jgi:hypothetical protein